MWWRIELDRDGAILSCEHSSMSGTSKGRVQFVEADSKEGACDAAVSQYRKRILRGNEWNTKTRTRRKSQGKCISCELKATHGVRCDRHGLAHSESTRRGRRGETTDRRYPSEQLAAEAWRRQNVSAQARHNAKTGGSTGRTLSRCLARLDTEGPENIGTWLVSEIERCKARTRAAWEKKHPGESLIGETESENT